ncbi:MAG: hypothetical protein Q4G25_08890 [Paracoccus sp. (in: a-proteobacteria)]|nr:hypothetical protein [Paracoccus sp. (in: a-proteobacteria)]
MNFSIRYRLIQILELVLWLGFAAALGMIGNKAWEMRAEGLRAVIAAIAPELLMAGAVIAALIVLIGIYHATRRNGDALDRLARQGAAGLRRLPGAGAAPVAMMAHDIPAPAPAVVPAPAPAPMPAPVTAAPAPAVAAPAAAPPAPVLQQPDPAPSQPAAPEVPPDAPAFPPPPRLMPAAAPARTADASRGAGPRRLGPAS